MLFKSEKEISLNQESKESIRKFFEFYDEFVQNKTQLKSNVFSHFQEVRNSN
jgi:hypothetical protein